MTEKDPQAQSSETKAKEKVDKAVEKKDKPKKEESAQEWKERYIRLYAEHENSKKRLHREQLNRVFMANKRLILDLLPTLDDLERAIESLHDTKTEKETQKGLSLILTNLHKSLADKGLQTMEIAIGQEPDPQSHHILTQMPTKDEKLKGKIVKIVTKGYFLHHTVIRHAQVIIGV